VGSLDGLPGRVHDNDQQPRCASFGEGQGIREEDHDVQFAN
jgi:hypothetical protein